MLNIFDKVVYQIYPKSFQDSNGDGIGDINGIIQRLPYIKALGVDYIWLTPIYPSPQLDNGYDVSNYKDIDPMYGTMKDFENLIAMSNQMGIGIMMDMVFNHTSTQHEWFQKAIANDKKYQDYYIFKESITSPNNWISKFGNSAWEYEPRIKKWYLHLFDTSQADLNWDNPQVRKELEEIVLFWKKKGVSGFRFDVINLISKPKEFIDDDIGDGRRFYTDGINVHKYLKELVKNTGIEDMITVGEMSSTSIEHCIRYSNPKEKELSMTFNFHHLKIDYKENKKFHIQEADYKKLKKILIEWSLEMQKGNGRNALFWCNHDQPRIVSRLGEDKRYHIESATMLATMIHMLKGTPYIYQGEEIGMRNAYFDKIEYYRDVESINYYKILLEEKKNPQEIIEILQKHSRDNGRTPMQWDRNEKNYGFTRSTPWISVGKQADDIDVESQIHDPKSILSYYRKLIDIRKKETLISLGEINFPDIKDDKIFVIERKFKEKSALILLNLGEDEKSYTIPYDKYEIVIHNYDKLIKEDSHILLRAYEAIVLKRKYN